MKAANDDNVYSVHGVPYRDVGHDEIEKQMAKLRVRFEAPEPPRDRWWHIALAWALCVAVGAMAGAMI